MQIKLTILGELASKANSRRNAKIRGKPAFIKSAKALNFVQSALLQIPSEAKQMISCDVCFEAHIFYASRRPDLDESLIMDILQAKIVKGVVVRKGVYINDRQIKEKHIYWGLDKENPRVEIVVRKLMRD
jgi:Holliday junction resolvase RusA-like endonuclease